MQGRPGHRRIGQGSLTYLIILLLSAACNKPKLFTKMNAGSTGIDFKNSITETKELNVLTFPYIYNGGGVAVGDVNGDGLKDLFFSGNMVSSRLYLNHGDFHFEDVTEKAGLTTTRWCTGTAMVDINGDGLLDIYVCTINPIYGRSSKNQFFINQGLDKEGIPQYKDMAGQMGLADTGFSTQAAFFDYDRDGDLDMYLLINGNVNYNRNEIRKIITDGSDPATGRLYRNDGIPPGRTVPVFTNVSKQAGITQQGWGLGVVVCDLNKDNWPDLYIANDFLSNDQLLINNHDGSFTNTIAHALKHQSQNSMGTDAADINNDGLPDIVTADMKPFDNIRDKTMFGKQNYDLFQLQLLAGYQPELVRNSLQLNNGNNTFSEIGQLANISATDWSWSVLFADFDNDGYKDLFISNGYGKDVTNLDYLNYMSDGQNNFFGNDSSKKEKAYRQLQKLKNVELPNFLYRNGHDLRFTDMAAEWGLDQPSMSNGAVYADLDNDGDLDLVVSNINQQAFVYQNHLLEKGKEKGQHYWLHLLLQQKGFNKDALGSKVDIYYGRQQQYAELTRQRGFMSSVDNTLYFGLDTISVVDSLKITWPDGKVQRMKSISADQLLRVSYNQPEEAPAETTGPNPVLKTLQATGIDHRHVNNGYVDFKTQPLIPYQYSRCGPAIAIGDIDGDGLDDLFTGGAAGAPNYFFIQGRDGKFRQRVFEASKPYEDMGALLFDADNDGDLDLFIVSGGSEYPAGSPWYQPRFYRNDGKGHFKCEPGALPPMQSSGSAVVAADIDRDGDLDLFVAGKAEAQHYPLPARSYLLRNDGGKFTDVTVTLAPALQKPGIVNAALFTDFNNDGQPDLILAGEWMPPSFFRNDNGHFTDITPSTGVGDKTGWWNSIVSGDFNNDGKMDYIAGNMGLNTRYKAGDTQPVSLYAKDFNSDGFIDPVMTYYLNNKEVTAAYRDDMIKQIIGVRRRFPLYADFGKADFDQILTPAERKDASCHKATWMYTSIIENKGNGRFSIRPLPNQTQTAPIYGMQAGDIDGDGYQDLLMIGNQYSSNTTIGQYDAFNGLLLRGNGKGTMTPQSIRQSGFVNGGDGKALAILAAADGREIIIATNNNDSTRIFQTLQPAGKVIRFKPLDMYAILHHQNGTITKVEAAYGGGYLSQASRILTWTPDLAYIEITDYKGVTRRIDDSGPRE